MDEQARNEAIRAGLQERGYQPAEVWDFLDALHILEHHFGYRLVSPDEGHEGG